MPARIFDKIKEKPSNEFIDIVKWLDTTDHNNCNSPEHYQNEIRNRAKLSAEEGQPDVFVKQGQLADVFELDPCTQNYQNLPILVTLRGWKYGFNSAFKAEVFFVRTQRFNDEKRGIENPATLNDERFGLADIRAFGTYAFGISDTGRFIVGIIAVIWLLVLITK